MIMAMRSNKDDFSLLIPYVRFRPQTHPGDNLVLLDTSAIIDGRVAGLLEYRFIEVPWWCRNLFCTNCRQLPIPPIQFGVRGRRGLDLLQQLRANPRLEIKVHDVDYADEKDVDSKLIRLAKALGARLYTTDYNLGKVADLQSVPYSNLTELATLLKPVTLPEIICISTL